MNNNNNNSNEKNYTNEQENNSPIAQENPLLTPQEESYKDQLLRISADFNNYKRRIEKERSDWAITAQGMVLEKLLSIFDELDRALELAEKQEAHASWLEGFKLIQKNWQKIFTELTIEEIPQIGQFDPALHEGLVQIEDATKESGSIAQTFSKGYRFKGKVLRHAKVSVVK